MRVDELKSYIHAQVETFRQEINSKPIIAIDQCWKMYILEPRSFIVVDIHVDRFKNEASITLKGSPDATAQNAVNEVFKDKTITPAALLRPPPLSTVAFEPIKLHRKVL